MRFPLIAVILTLLLTWGSLRLGGFIGSEFLPTTDDGTITISLTLDNSASLGRTEEMVRRVEAFISTMKMKEQDQQQAPKLGMPCTSH